MAGEEGVIEVGAECEDLLRSAAGCSEGEVRAVACAVAAVLAGEQREDAALEGAELQRPEVDVIKALYSALACVFAEAAKGDASTGAVVAFLRKSGVEELQAGVAGQIFAGAKERLRKELSRTGEYSSIARLQGVDWRLEYRSSEAPPRRDLLYHVVLKTAEKSAAGEVPAKTAFVCSVEQLQDLVVTLKDACKAVERVVHQG